MAGKFTSFVLKLAQDPSSLREFQKEPKAMMRQADLSTAEQAILQSNDPTLIRNAIAADTEGPEKLAAFTIVITAVIIIHSETEGGGGSGQPIVE